MTHDWPRRWTGAWIWTPEDLSKGDPISPYRGARDPKRAQFRHDFTLDAVPASAPARITADSRYRLRINGALVGQGPVRSQPRRLAYNSYDIAPYLTLGRNVIEVDVHYYGRPNSFWMPAVGNATLGRTGVLVFEADCGPMIATGPNWQARLCKATLDDATDLEAHMVGGGVPAESYDARLAGGDWQAATVIVPIHMGGPGRPQPPADPYGPLEPHGLSAPTQELLTPASVTACAVDTPAPTHIAPAAVTEASWLSGEGRAMASGLPCPATDAAHTRYVIDMGRIVTGYVGFSVDGPAGAKLDIGYTELPVTEPAHFGAHGGTRYIARGHDDRFETFDRLGFRYATIVTYAPVTLNSFTVREVLYPWTGDHTLTSSDKGLERLHRTGIRTVAVNSWDAFIDCPTREQRAWTGDSVVHLMTHLVANDDLCLCWRNLTLAASPRSDGILPMSVAGDVEYGEGFTIPDWSLHWVHGLYLMYRHTADLTRIRPLLHVAEGILRWFLPYLGKDGLLHDLPEWNLIDWSSIHTSGTCAASNALWARGLSEYTEMAAALGNQGSAAWATDLHAGVKTGFEAFWLPDRNLYRDHLASAVCNQISTAAAIAAGLVPTERITKAAEAMITNVVERSWLFGGPDGFGEDPQRFGRVITSTYVPDWDVDTQVVSAQPFMSYVVHDALAIADLSDRIPALLTRWNRYLTDGFDTFGEVWTGNSHAHGWSSCPTRDLVSYVLGITPAKAGYTKARIAPRTGGTEMAGSVPTPHGPIKVQVVQGQATIDSPVPFLFDPPSGRTSDHPAGKYTLPL